MAARNRARTPVRIRCIKKTTSPETSCGTADEAYKVPPSLTVAVMNATGTAFASADDYAFELVRGQIRSSNIATIAVRLVKKSTGRPGP